MKHVTTLIFFCLIIAFPWNGQTASYTGKNAGDAAHYIDNSQNVKGFGYSNKAHPRDHASTYGAPSNYPSVENYSLKTGQDKSGFDSRDIQNEVAHHILIHPKVQKALKTLNLYNKQTNNGPQFKRQDVKLSKNDLSFSNSKLTGGKWSHGNKIKSFKIGGAVIVLQHFKGKETDPNAAVHIQTLYPN